MHASRSRGAGLEFAQYRGYEPGDEPRRIDWKLFARSDRYFVREAERDSPLTLWIVIDASASMALADRARPDFSKLEAAKLPENVMKEATRELTRLDSIPSASPEYGVRCGSGFVQDRWCCSSATASTMT